MLQHWRGLLCIFLCSLLSSFVHGYLLFENTAIVRTVILGGSSVRVTTLYEVKALESGAELYEIALGREEKARTSWLEATVKGATQKLPIKDLRFDSFSGTHSIAITLPRPLQKGSSLTLVVNTVQTNATRPWPPRASQSEPQSLKHDFDLFVLSPYHTVVQRTKIRSPSPRIISFTEPKNVEQFASENSATTKSGTITTYGPFYNIEPVTPRFVREYQQRVEVQYGYESPVLEIIKLKRAAEISHWGANLNIQNEIQLRNAGPELSGHFSRIEYQTQNFYQRSTPHILSALILHLPAGIRDVYYYDLVGNVSTSRFRKTPSPPRNAYSNQFSVLELKPRYPLLGGWNYTFTLGWDAPLQDSARWDGKAGRYIVGVPVLTPIPGTIVHEAEVKIILPEKATGIEYFLPFPAISTSVSTHTTYLDTVGRPAITFKFEQLNENHNSIIYVAYRVPFSAHLQKLSTVTVAFFVLFVVALGWRRLDLRIHSK